MLKLDSGLSQGAANRVASVALDALNSKAARGDTQVNL